MGGPGNQRIAGGGVLQPQGLILGTFPTQLLCLLLITRLWRGFLMEGGCCQQAEMGRSCASFGSLPEAQDALGIGGADLDPLVFADGGVLDPIGSKLNVFIRVIGGNITA